MTSPARRVVLFAREPVAGHVKTRLAREIGDAAATALYGAFLQDLAAELPDPGRWDAVLAHAEPEAGPFLKETFRLPWTFVPQGAGTLGERVKNAFEGAGTGAHVLVAGSDAPTLSRHDLDSAFRALEGGAGIVFAPSPDGGFSLVGVAGRGERGRGRRPGEGRPGDFLEGVRWSTGYALEDARRAAERLGRRVALLAPVPDVDALADLVALSSSLTHSKNPNSSVATRRAIEAHVRRGAA
jgi:glycosyltransferase A (GT-A) superfamily protein (DUF2064 family)